MEGAEVSNPFPRQHLGVVFAAGGVDDLPRLLVGGEGPGDGGYGDIRLQVSQDAGGVGPQVGAAYGDILHALGAVAARQGVVREHVDDHIPAGPLHHQLGEVVGYQRVDLGIGPVDSHGQVHFLIAVVRTGRAASAAAAQGQQRRQENPCDCFAMLH